MKTFSKMVIALGLLLSTHQHIHANSKVGFSMPDSLDEYTVQYTSFDNLIVLPFIINDSIKVNLILDTGCRNIILFGRKFKKQMRITPTKSIEFSGMGAGKSVSGMLSLNNSISLGQITGENVPMIVVPKRGVFQDYSGIDGLIGYDIFTKFEVELNPATQHITFRSAFSSFVPYGYTQIPMKVSDAQPILQSTIEIQDESYTWDLLIDTGSSLGLLLKSTDFDILENSVTYHSQLGRGLNGIINGKKTVAERLLLDNFEFNKLTTGIIYTPWYDYASIGMDILKDYSIILNYVQSYICLKKVSMAGA